MREILIAIPWGMLLVFCVRIASAQQRIEAIYDLYDPSGRQVSTMTIYGQKGETFSIRGSGWTGSGRLSGSRPAPPYLVRTYDIAMTFSGDALNGAHVSVPAILSVTIANFNFCG